MAQKEVLLIVLVIISLVNAKGNYSKKSYKSSSANIKLYFEYIKNPIMFIYLLFR